MLNSIEELKNYLTSKDTCICGLKLPFSVEEVFSFDPKVIGLQEQLDEEELRQHIYRQPTLIEPTSDGQQKVIGHVPMDSDSPPSEGDLPYDATALTVSAETAGETEDDIPFFAKMSSSSQSEVVSIIWNVDKCYQKVSPPELDNTRAPISSLNKGSELSEYKIPTSTSEIVSEQVEVECSNPDEFDPTMLRENMCDEIIKAISTGIEEGKLSSVDCDAYEPLPNVDNINVYHNEYKIGTDFIESEKLSIASPSKFPNWFPLPNWSYPPYLRPQDASPCKTLTLYNYGIDLFLFPLICFRCCSSKSTQPQLLGGGGVSGGGGDGSGFCIGCSRMPAVLHHPEFNNPMMQTHPSGPPSSNVLEDHNI